MGKNNIIIIIVVTSHHVVMDTRKPVQIFYDTYFFHLICFSNEFEAFHTIEGAVVCDNIVNSRKIKNNFIRIYFYIIFFFFFF